MTASKTIPAIAGVGNVISFAYREGAVYEKFTQQPFNELILSWNGFRPAQGCWTFYVSLFQSEWSPFLEYAQWGATWQKTFHSSTTTATSYQDAVTPKSGLSTGFRIVVKPALGADISTLHELHVCTSDTSQFQIEPVPALASLHLNGIFPHCQMLLPHPRHRDLCSPTSTTAAINFLWKKKLVDPLVFASKVHDNEFDIYGNWILNTAAAYEALEGNYQTYVARLSNFSAAHAALAKGLPVVVSVKGPLPGGATPYSNGHLLLLIGYDSLEKTVLCMDPAFSSDRETIVSYPIAPFLQAWGRRRNLAYFFEPKFFISRSNSR